jgi:hypothetical protein
MSGSGSWRWIGKDLGGPGSGFPVYDRMEMNGT